MITSVTYTSLGSAVAITLDDGSVWHDDASLPADTHIRRELARWRENGGVITPFAESVAPPPVPPPITRRQCAIELRARGLISPAEAVAMVATATPPGFVETAFAAMPEPQQTSARIDFAAGSYERGNPLLVSLMSATGASGADIDAFFRSAGAK